TEKRATSRRAAASFLRHAGDSCGSQFGPLMQTAQQRLMGHIEFGGRPTDVPLFFDEGFADERVLLFLENTQVAHGGSGLFYRRGYATASETGAVHFQPSCIWRSLQKGAFDDVA